MNRINLQNLQLVFLFLIVIGCNTEDNMMNQSSFIHSCRLQKSNINFYDLSGLIDSEEYFYNQENLVFKRVKKIPGTTFFSRDSIVYDAFGRVTAEYFLHPIPPGFNINNTIREYFYTNVSDLNPFKSEFYILENGAKIFISTEKYFYVDGNLHEMNRENNGMQYGVQSRIESFEYDDKSNLLSREIFVKINGFTSSSIYTYSNFDSMVNPVRNFPFRDLIGFNKSTNNYRELNYISGSLDSLGEFISMSLSGLSISKFDYNEFGYPVRGLEYDCQ